MRIDVCSVLRRRRIWRAPASAAPPDVPSWVPAAGSVATLTQTNGGLSNTFRSQVASNYQAAFFVKTVNDYSGAVSNPHWGTYGAKVFFGGGHSATNDNSVTVAEYGASAITFKRVSVPTNWPGTDPDDLSNIYTTPDLNLTYMEALADGQLGSPHSYHCGDIIAPADGGAAYGTFLQVVCGAIGYNGSGDPNGAAAAHQMLFDSLELGTRKWARRTNNTGGFTFGAPLYTVLVPAQQRVYIFHQGGGLPAAVRWFNLSTDAYVLGSGAASLEIDAMDGFDSGRIFHVPSRNLIVGCWPASNLLKVQWMDVSASQPTLGGTATLSSSLAVSDPWSMACWCPDNNRIIVGGVNSDSGAVHEIEIPATLSDTWTVTRRAFPSGTMPKGDTSSGLTYKKFDYDSGVKSIVYMPLAASSGDDTVWVYRPVGT